MTVLRWRMSSRKTVIFSALAKQELEGAARYYELEHEVIQLGWGTFVLGEFLVSLVLLQGIGRLHRTVNPAALAQHGQPEIPLSTSTEQRAFLPSQQMSVTEGTTEPMNSAEVPISIEPAKNTDSIT